MKACRFATIISHSEGNVRLPMLAQVRYVPDSRTGPPRTSGSTLRAIKDQGIR